MDPATHAYYTSSGPNLAMVPNFYDAPKFTYAENMMDASNMNSINDNASYLDAHISEADMEMMLAATSAMPMSTYQNTDSIQINEHPYASAAQYYPQDRMTSMHQNNNHFHHYPSYQNRRMSHPNFPVDYRKLTPRSGNALNHNIYVKREHYDMHATYSDSYGIPNGPNNSDISTTSSLTLSPPSHSQAFMYNQFSSSMPNQINSMQQFQNPSLTSSEPKFGFPTCSVPGVHMPRRKRTIISSDPTIPTLYCKFCNQPFSRKNSLRRHEMLHSGDRPYRCLPCNKTFSRQDIYKRHCLSRRCQRLKDNDHWIDQSIAK